jgi:hypothetical protein
MVFFAGRHSYHLSHSTSPVLPVRTPFSFLLACSIYLCQFSYLCDLSGNSIFFPLGGQDDFLLSVIKVMVIKGTALMTAGSATCFFVFFFSATCLGDHD